MGILAFVIILGVLVFVHELGHFLVARWSGVTVKEFGFGFPPRIVGRQIGKTLVSINWIPFGGFVLLQGENGETHDDPGDFSRARGWKKVAILSAGVFMNALLAWVIFSATFAIGVVTDPSQVPHDSFAHVGNVSYQALVSPNSAAANAGLQDGAQVVSVNGVVYHNSDELITAIKEQNYPDLTVVSKNSSGVTSTVIVHPAPAHGNDPRYGFGIQGTATVRYSWYIAPWYGIRAVASAVGQTFAGFGQLVVGLSRGHVSQDLTGPIGIAVLTNQVQQLGIISLLQFMGLLSISLAVLNILPLPALDGGRAFFVIWAAVTRKPVSQRTEMIVHAVGFYALILLVVVISVHDVQRFALVQRLTSLFQR